MFERFTERTRRVLILAQEEARLLNHHYVGSEHLLLGLIHEGEGAAAAALHSLGIRLEDARKEVARASPPGSAPPSGHIPFTTNAKNALEASLPEAVQRNQRYIGTEHLLLGLLSQGESRAVAVLRNLGAEPERVRKQVMRVIEGPPRESAGVPSCPRCGAELSRSARARSVEIAGEAGGTTRTFTAVYCGACGATLGVLA